MKYVLFLFLLLPLSLAAQNTTPRSPQGSLIFTFVEQMPVFPGGDPALQQFLKENLKYPPEARAAKVHGLVVVQFVVDLDGSISEPVVVKKLGYGLDEEAVRLVNRFPRFIPGRQNGKPVAVRFTQPFRF